jgi:hypothetical protein
MAAEFADLVSYFERLAREHTEIRHSATEKHFYRFELEELLVGMITKIKYPALVLEGYDFMYQDSGSDNVSKKRNGAFMLLTHVSDPLDFNGIALAIDRLERIGEDILIKMRADKASRAVPVLRGFNIYESDGLMLRVSQTGQYGLRFSFSLSSAVDTNVDSTRWTTSPA